MFRKKKLPRKGTDLRERASQRPQFSYYSSGANRSRTDTSTDMVVDQSNLKHRLRLLPSILAIAVIVGCILFSLTLTGKPSVETLNNEPSPYRPLEEYAQATAEIMGNSPGNLTKFTANTQEVESELLTQYPELKAAVIRLPILGRRPNLVLDIESPAILLATPTKSYVLDSSGTAVSEVATLSAEARAGLFVVQDQSGLKIEVGTHALPSDTISFISEAVAYLKAQNLTVSQLTLPQSANQLDIRIEGVPYYVKTDISGDAQLQTGSFLAVKGRLEQDGVEPSEYIDVRVEEKVFYK